ncbi:MAG TPA: methyltransferase domain-containing protein [Synergistales bacterium]|nr:methyltransferase domain-containing protein [Synergistales bacterium]HQQ10404.1 methyltransferase domain-containing protein [Synergistales bacterium]
MPDERVFRNEYDFIICSEVAEHSHSPGKEFEKMHDLLRPGGILVVMTCFMGDDTGFPG